MKRILTVATVIIVVTLGVLIGSIGPSYAGGKTTAESVNVIYNPDGVVVYVSGDVPVQRLPPVKTALPQQGGGPPPLDDRVQLIKKPAGGSLALSVGKDVRVFQNGNPVP